MKCPEKTNLSLGVPESEEGNMSNYKQVQGISGDYSNILKLDCGDGHTTLYMY